MKILITGGSGFIGTNLIEYYISNGEELLNIDIKEPRNSAHHSIWKNVDILDYDSLSKIMLSFSPDYVIHLAARTDLNEKETLKGYDSNIVGVENIIKICNKISNLKRVLYTSSMLVCRPGYVPSSYEDYDPPNLYGISKVLGEVIVKKSKVNHEWTIIRPTSIWGPWFSEPYRNFFDLIVAKKYFHIGNKLGIKTFGYVGNSVDQLACILLANEKDVNHKVFYIGDYEPLCIEKFADCIAKELGIRNRRLPYVFAKIAAIFGDIVSGIIRFPMSSYRLNNMVNNNIINLDDTRKLLNSTQSYSLREGVKKTLKWLSS